MKASKQTKSLSSPAAVQRGAYNLPSHDALAQILSDHHSVLTKDKPGHQSKANRHTPNERVNAAKGTQPNAKHTKHLLHPHKGCPLCGCECVPRQAGFTELQTQEVEAYRSAMSRMAEDIIALRTEVTALEAVNLQLGAEAALHRELGQELLEDTDVDVMTKAELADRIDTLRSKLAKETSKTTSQWDRIHQLQNDLIRKNDSEEELLKLRKVHKLQGKDLQSVLAKMESLEVTVQQQQKVIEQMKKGLNYGGETKHGELVRVHKGSTSTKENTHPRKDLDWIHRPALIFKQTEKGVIFPEGKPTAPQQGVQETPAEAGTRTLDSQGEQKPDLQNERSRKKHGLLRTTTTILHNGPLVAS